MPGRLWTQSEVTLLQTWWGELSVKALAEKLGRSVRGVADKSHSLGLGRASRGQRSVYTLEQDGYHRIRIVKAMKVLGIRPKVGIGGSAFWGGKRKYLSEDQYERVLAFLAKHPDGERLFNPKNKHRTKAGEWGTGRKPPACVRCGTKDRPHKGRGRCGACRAAEIRERKKAA